MIVKTHIHSFCLILCGWNVKFFFLKKPKEISDSLVSDRLVWCLIQIEHTTNKKYEIILK